MSTGLINVRLDRDRLRKVRKLKEQGVVLSDLVRDAIDRRFQALSSARPSTEADAIVNRLFEQYPDSADAAIRSYSVHDRRQARAAIVGRLRRERAR
jgi:hypothetical protein